MLVISVISPYKVDRYIFCVYPLVTVALFMLFARGGCRFGSRRSSACLLACAVLAACGARVNRDQQVHYLYPGDSAYVAACEENAALPCILLGTNDMTQNTLELAAFERVYMLNADDAQGVAPHWRRWMKSRTVSSSLNAITTKRTWKPFCAKPGWKARNSSSSINITSTGCIKL